MMNNIQKVFTVFGLLLCQLSFAQYFKTLEYKKPAQETKDGKDVPAEVSEKESFFIQSFDYSETYADSVRKATGEETFEKIPEVQNVNYKVADLTKNGNKRVALLIVNSKEAQGDEDIAEANFLAETLNKLGFKLLILQDGSLEQMKQELNKLKAETQDAKVAMVFFAGPAVAEGSETYLLAADSTKSVRNPDKNALALKDVANAVAASESAILVIDSPFNDLPKGAAPAKVLLAYPNGAKTTNQGTVPFYKELSKQLRRKQTLNEVFINTQIHTKLKSRYKVIPWFSDHLQSEYSLILD